MNNTAESQKEKPKLDPIERASSLKLLAAGFGLSFIHLFWYGSPWTAWLGFICYAPFIVWIQNHSRKPFRAGLIFGYYYALMNTLWLGQFVGRWTSSVLIGAFVIFVVGSVWGTFYGLACWLQAKMAMLRAPFIFAFLMFLMELGRMNIPQLEFPFTPIGEPLVVYPVFAGTFHSALIACFLTLQINACASIPLTIGLKNMAKTFGPALPRFAALFGGTAILAIGIGIFMPKKPTTKIGVRIGLGQLGTDLAYGDEHTEAMRVAIAGDDLIRQARAQNADLLILPEGVASFRTTPNTPFTLTSEQKVLFGAQRGTGPTYQSAFLWDGNGYRYTDKNRLVVFGEYVPFRGIIPYPAGFQLPSGDLAAGTERRLLEVKPGVTVGAMICFESLFASSARDFNDLNATFLTIMSLDDWYMGTNAIPRLEIAARWRAVETKKWIVRVGSLGKTMVIDPKGVVQAQIPTDERRLLVYDL